MNIAYGVPALALASLAIALLWSAVFVMPALPPCDSCSWAARFVTFDPRTGGADPKASARLSQVSYAEIYVGGKRLDAKITCHDAYAVVVGGVAYVGCGGAPAVPLSIVRAEGDVSNLCATLSVTNAIYVQGSDTRDLRKDGIWAKVVNLKKFWDAGYTSVTLTPNGVSQYAFKPIPDVIMDYVVFWEDCTSCDPWPSASVYTDEVLRVVVFKNMTVAILQVHARGGYQHEAVINWQTIVIKQYNVEFWNRWINTGITLDPAEPFTFAVYGRNHRGQATHYTSFTVGLKSC